MRVKIQMDRNGNKVVTITGNEAGRGFSIQTNGNLPKIHHFPLGKATIKIPSEEALEITVYLITCGTDKQKAVWKAA